MSVGVQLFLHQLVRDEVNSLEGDVHGQLRAVAPVKGSQALRAGYRLNTVPKSAIRRIVHLHPLLYH